MAQVFITQQPTPNKNGWTPDLSSAAEYGTLKFVYPAKMQVNARIDECVQMAIDTLASFDAEEDYILFPNTGDPASKYVILMVLGNYYGFHKLSFLYWSRKRDENGAIVQNRGFYMPITIEMPDDPDMPQNPLD